MIAEGFFIIILKKKTGEYRVFKRMDVFLTKYGNERDVIDFFDP